MATSSIFTSVKITDPEKVIMFMDMLENADKQSPRKPTTSNFSHITNIDEIRKMMARKKE